jgi:hypothetical protein
MFPLALVAAVVLVVCSRVLGFQPGFIFGITCGVAFSTEIGDADEGRSAAVVSIVLLVLAISSWLLWIPVASAAQQPGATIDIRFFDAFLSTLWVGGIQAVLFGLLPMRFLPGEKVWAWSPKAWIALYGTTVFVFVQAIAHPSSGQWGSGRASFWSMLFPFAVYSAVAVGVWVWFRFVRRPTTFPVDADAGQDRHEQPARLSS